MNTEQFNNSLLYSNKNIEKVASKLVAESANAVLLEMFTDKAILADHKTGIFYESSFSYDGKNFVFSDFSPIQLEKKPSKLVETISDYFDDNVVSLAEAYKQAVSAENLDIIQDSLTEAISKKNLKDVIDYSELDGFSNTSEAEAVKNLPFFEAYKERLDKKPSSTIKYFNWKDPVKVSLIDEDKNKFTSKSEFKKAKALKSDVDFKKSLLEASNNYLNGDEEALKTLVEENSCLLALDKSALEELVGFSVLESKEALSHRKDIVNFINETVESDELLSERKQRLMEAEKEDDGSDDDDVPDMNDKDTEALVKALEKAKELCDDEKLADKIDDLINNIQSDDTDVAAVKEAVEIISL